MTGSRSISSLTSTETETEIESETETETTMGIEMERNQKISVSLIPTNKGCDDGDDHDGCVLVLFEIGHGKKEIQIKKH